MNVEPGGRLDPVELGEASGRLNPLGDGHRKDRIRLKYHCVLNIKGRAPRVLALRDSHSFLVPLGLKM